MSPLPPQPFRDAVTLDPPASMTPAVDRLKGLVGAAIDGDRRSIERLLAEVCPWLVRYCRARVGRVDGSFAAADELAREVCLAVFTALPRYRGQARPFVGFVYDIVTAKVTETGAAAAHDPSPQPGPSAANWGDTAGNGHRAGPDGASDPVAWLLRALPTQAREILLLRVVAGFSVEQTADALGCTPAAVRVAEHRAMAQGRDIVSSQEGD